ncbi:MAG: Rpn family recombination-promoting nuclease/putative transposase [Anaerolineales bacterium]|nr:Rpn family recombination-promoting nuclease/putative transposase [Anaerolineales bacterium]
MRDFLGKERPFSPTHSVVRRPSSVVRGIIPAMRKLTNPHDKFFKETFTRLETARDFFANYLPAPVTAVLDLLTLQL